MENIRKNTLRNSNFEIMRIFAMVSIIVIHYAVHGVMQVNTINDNCWLDGNLMNKILTILLSGGAVCRNLFFILSGYFLIKRSTISITKIKKIYFHCLFYSVLAVAIFLVAYSTHFYSYQETTIRWKIGNLIKAFVPIDADVWWFATAYFILYLLSPSLNQIFGFLQKKLRVSYFVLSFFWVALPYLIPERYQMLYQAVFYYLMGSYFSLNYEYSGLYNVSKFFDLLFCIFLLLLFGVIEIVYIFNIFNLDNDLLTVYKYFYPCLQWGGVAPICSFFLFSFFYKLKLANNKKINIIAGCTFGIYLLHDNALVSHLIWNKIFICLKHFHQNFILYISHILFSSVIIFVLGIIIDLFRKKVIEERLLYKFLQENNFEIKK